MSSSGQALVIRIMNSQRLQMPALDLNKMQPINSQTLVEEGFRGPHPSLLNYLLLADTWRKGVITFSQILPNDSTRLQ